MEIETKYRSCMVCGKHIAEITRDKSGHSHSKIRYYSNADVLTIARFGKMYCKDCSTKKI